LLRAALLPGLLALLTLLLLVSASLWLVLGRGELVIRLRPEQVQERLEGAFPVRKELLLVGLRVGEVVLSRPQVRLAAGSKRVGFAADCAITALGKTQLRGRASLSGRVRWDAGHEAGRGALFLEDARLDDLDVGGLPREVGSLVAPAATAAVREYLDKQPLYRPARPDVALPLWGRLRLKAVAVEGGVLKVTLARGT